MHEYHRLKNIIHVLNQTAHVAMRVHMYERVKLVRVTRVSDTCHTHLPLNLSLVCTVLTQMIHCPIDLDPVRPGCNLD